MVKDKRMKSINFNVPVKMQFKTKKKISNKLISYNLIFAMNNMFSKSKFKKKYKDLITSCLPKDTEQLKGKYRIDYIYHYENKGQGKNSDAPNVISILSKSINDLLQELEIVVNDNVMFCVSESWIIGEPTDEPYVNVNIYEA